MTPNDLYIGLIEFLDKGGIVLWAILALSIVLFTLIGERFIDLKFFTLTYIQNIRKQMHEKPVHYQLVRLQKQTRIHFFKRMGFIKLTIAMLPLFGLLGTVTGMIEVFEVMATFGNSNPRLMASGVARAIIPTMSGMALAVFALLSLYALTASAKKRHRLATKELNKVYNATL